MTHERRTLRFLLLTTAILTGSARVAVQPVDSAGPPLPFAGRLHVEPGETLYLLTNHGEGVTTAWFRGRLYDEVDGSEFINAICDLRPGTCNGTIVDKPQKVWSVRVRNRNRATGWTNETEKFDNKDRFG